MPPNPDLHPDLHSDSQITGAIDTTSTRFTCRHSQNRASKPSRASLPLSTPSAKRIPCQLANRAQIVGLSFGARLGTAVRHSMTLTSLVLSLAFSGLALSGCAIAPRAQADEPSKQPAAANARLIEQSKAAMAACDAKFPAGDPTTAVVRRQCINDGFAIKLPTFGPDQDLVRGVMADSMVIAGQVQSGKMTIAEGNAAIAEKWSKAVSESQRRANSKNSVLAQQSAAAAQQQSGGGCGARRCHTCRASRLYLHPKRQRRDVQLRAIPWAPIRRARRRPPQLAAPPETASATPAPQWRRRRTAPG